VTTAQHQFKIINRRKVIALCRHRLDDRLLWIVNQYQNMRQFQRRTLANPHPWRDPFQNRALSRPDERLRAFVVIISFQIQRQHQTAACPPFNGSLNVNQPFISRQQIFRQVGLHRLLCAFNPPGFFWRFQINFRQRQPKC